MLIRTITRPASVRMQEDPRGALGVRQPRGPFDHDSSTGHQSRRNRLGDVGERGPAPRESDQRAIHLPCQSSSLTRWTRLAGNHYEWTRSPSSHSTITAPDECAVA